jgi:hypothetical protein
MLMQHESEDNLQELINNVLQSDRDKIHIALVVLTEFTLNNDKFYLSESSCDPDIWILVYNLLMNRIDKFKSPKDEIERNFFSWVNKSIRFRYLDYKKTNEYSSFSRRTKLNNSQCEFINIDAVENYTSSNVIEGIDLMIEREEQSILNNLLRYIHEDPEGELRKLHVRTHNDINCQMLTYSLFIKDPPDKISDIAKEFNISYQTLSSMWQRKCIPCLRRIGLKFLNDISEGETSQKRSSY